MSLAVDLLMLINENKELPWHGHPKIGWWQDQEHLTLYHGTYKSNLHSVLKNGITHKDPKTGMVSMALEPNTAFGYASMHGGKANFRKVGGKAQHVPDKDRVVVVAKIPKHFITQHHDVKLGGNIGDASKRLKDQELHKTWKGQDSEYYALSELRFKHHIPPEFIHGYMVKGK